MWLQVVCLNGQMLYNVGAAVLGTRNEFKAEGEAYHDSSYMR